MIPILFGLLLIGILVFAFWWDFYRGKTDTQITKMKGKFKIFLLLVAVGFLGLCLFFHIVPSEGKIFPKNNPTFANTFITEDDLKEFSEHFNNASALEQVALLTDPLYRKLIEEGLLIKESKR